MHVQRTFWGYKPEIPVLNKGQKQATHRPYISQEDYRAGGTKFGSQALTKPGHKLGASHISDAKHEIGSFKLCDSCITKYWKCWEKTNHKPSWGNYFTSDCDGCGEHYMLCILFVHEPQFHQVLTGMHGKRGSPKRTLFQFLGIQ